MSDIAEITDITKHLRAAPRPVKADDVVAEVKRMMGEQLIATIYRDRVRSIRTRSYKLNGSTKSTYTYSIPAGGTWILAPRDQNGQSPL